MAIAFDKKELEVERYGMNFADPTKKGAPYFKTPVSPKENFEAVYNKNGVWLPYGIEAGIFAPSVIPDNIARGFVFDATMPEYPPEKFGGPDMFGVEWEYVPVVGGSMEKPGVPHKLGEDVYDWKDKLTFPDIDAWDWDASARANEEFLKNGTSNMLWILNGMGFERLISFMGFENAAVALLDEDQEDDLKELFQALTDLHIKLVDRCIEAYGSAFSGFTVHDDWGSQRSPFFSEDCAEEFLVPGMKQLTDHIKSKGYLADLHSCGHIEDRIECIIHGGWQSWTPMPMNDTRKLYEEYGDQIIIGVVPEFDPNKDAYEQGKEFVAKYFKKNKPCSLSMYANLGNNEDFIKGIYEASRMSE